MSNKVKYEFKDFINIKDTFNGSIDNVRIEGNVLVNLASRSNVDINVKAGVSLSLTMNDNMTTIGNLTLINSTTKNVIYGVYDLATAKWRRNVKVSAGNSTYVQLNSDEYIGNIVGQFADGWEDTEECKAEFMKTKFIIEGDHTQNPPQYFEGIKSVGELEELEIASVNASKNLINIADIKNAKGEDSRCIVTKTGFKTNYSVTPVPFPYYEINNIGQSYLNCNIVKKGDNITIRGYTTLSDISTLTNYTFNKNIGSLGDISTIEIPNGTKYIVFHRANASTGEVEISNISVTKEQVPNIVTEIDRKKLLYKDSDDTWKPVVLRKASEDCKDYIEELADGKYKYRVKNNSKLCDGEVITWGGSATQIDTTLFYINVKDAKILDTDKECGIICDSINSDIYSNVYAIDKEGISLQAKNSNRICFRVLNSKTGITESDDLATRNTKINNWIANNPITVVYQLAQEEVYDCVNLDLQSYDGETSIFISSIIPSSVSCEIEFPNQIKADLHVAKQDYDKKYTALKNIINVLIAEGKVTPENQTKYNNAYKEYLNSISNVNVLLQKGLDVISNTKINNSKFEIMKEVSDMDKALTDLDVVMNGAFKDGVLSSSEKQAIQQHIQIVNTEKIDVEKQYANLYANSSLIGIPKTNLKNAYDSYISNHTNLLNTINTILNKTGLVDSVDQTNLNNSFKNYRDASGLYTQRVSEALDSIGTKKTADAKASLQKEISDVSKAVGNLEDTMEGVFKDGVLSDSEKLAVKQNLQIVQNEKADVDKDYTTTYANVNLEGTAKTNLKTAYDDYVAKYNTLVTVINDFVNKATIIDSSDQAKLNTAFANYRTANGLYSQRVNEAINSIGKKMADDSASTIDKKYADIIIGEDGILSQVGSIKTIVDKVEDKQTTTDDKVDALETWKKSAEVKITDSAIVSTVTKSTTYKNDLDGKVSSNNIISSINQTAEAIKIDANKVNLNGYVTMTNLSTPGQTTIDGGNVKTGTIEAIQIKACHFSGKNMVYIEDDGILSCDGNTYLRHLFIPETHPGWRPGTTGSFSCAPIAWFDKDVYVTNEIYTRGTGVVRRQNGVYIQIDAIGVQNTNDKNWMLINCYQSNHVFGVDLWYSDISLKENIINVDTDIKVRTINNVKTGLDLIKSINHYSYDYKESVGLGHEHVDCGYIAQQLKELNPGLVREVPQKDGSVLLEPRASMLIPHLSRAIQEQQEEITNLKNEVIELKKLEDRLKVLEEKLIIA